MSCWFGNLGLLNKISWEILPKKTLTWTISAMFIEPEPGEGYSGRLSAASPCRVFESHHQGGGGGGRGGRGGGGRGGGGGGGGGRGGWPNQTDIWDHLFRQLLVSKQAVDLVAVTLNEGLKLFCISHRMITMTSCYMYVLVVLTTAAKQNRRLEDNKSNLCVYGEKTILSLPFLTKWSSAPKSN